MSMCSGERYDELRALDDDYDDLGGGSRVVDYGEFALGLRGSWCLPGTKLRLTGQGAYGFVMDVAAGAGHGLNRLGQVDYRVFTRGDGEAAIWAGLSSGGTLAWLEEGHAHSANLSATLQFHY